MNFHFRGDNHSPPDSIILILLSRKPPLLLPRLQDCHPASTLATRSSLPTAVRRRHVCSNEWRPAGRVDKLDGRFSRRLGHPHSPNGHLVAVGSLAVRDVPSGTLVERVRGHKASVYSVAFITGLISGSLHAIGMVRHKVLFFVLWVGPLTMHRTTSSQLQVSHDGRWVVSGSKDQGLRVCFRGIRTRVCSLLPSLCAS